MTLGLTMSGYPERRLIDIDRDMERRACDAGFAVLVQGPLGLEQVFDELRCRARNGRAYFSADLGHFHAWLRTVKDVPALGGLTSVVRRYVFRHYPAKPDRPVLGVLPEQITHITFDEARSRAKLGVRFLQRLVAHVDGVPLADVLARTGITPADLDRVMAFWNSLCHLNEAGEILGVRPDHVKALIRVGVLSHLRFGSALRYPRRAEIADLLRAVEMLPCSQRFSGTITLRSFCATRSISLAHVVAAWRDGELDGLVSRGEGRGLEALHLNPEAFCDKVALCLDRDLSLTATARYLRISLTAIRKLRDVGLLRQIRKRNTDTNFWQGYIQQVQHS